MRVLDGEVVGDGVRVLLGVLVAVVVLVDVPCSSAPLWYCCSLFPLGAGVSTGGVGGVGHARGTPRSRRCRRLPDPSLRSTVGRTGCRGWFCRQSTFPHSMAASARVMRQRCATVWGRHIKMGHVRIGIAMPADGCPRAAAAAGLRRLPGFAGLMFLIAHWMA